jgi:hypothetical protein
MEPMDFTGFVPLIKNIYVSQRTSMMTSEGDLRDGFLIKVQTSSDTETIFGISPDQLEKLAILLVRMLDT